MPHRSRGNFGILAQHLRLRAMLNLRSRPAVGEGVAGLEATRALALKCVLGLNTRRLGRGRRLDEVLAHGRGGVRTDWIDRARLEAGGAECPDRSGAEG